MKILWIAQHEFGYTPHMTTTLHLGTIDLRFVSQFFCALLTLGATAAQLPAAEKQPPNIVFILADDMGYSDLGCYGGEIETPNLDKLAAGGLRFTSFYNTGRCWPSRAALLTGYYPQQVNRDPANARPRWAALLPELLKPAGYRSYHSGKWHVDGPVLAGGFLRSYNTIDYDRHLNPKRVEIDDHAAPVPKPGEAYCDSTAIADHAIEFLANHGKQHADAPFFMYVAFISPHFPLQAPADDIAKYRDRYKDGWDVVRAQRWKRIQELKLTSGEMAAREPEIKPSWNLSEAELQKRIGAGEVGSAVAWKDLTPEQQKFQAAKMAVHAAMVDRIDREVGRVVEQLKAMQALDNTVIMFASDNGASAEQIIRGDGNAPDATPGAANSFVGLGPGWSTAANTPFRLHKSWVHEGGISTPLIVHWPAGIAARGELRHTLGHFVDLTPTFLELAGAKSPDTWQDLARPPLPGRSLMPTFSKDAIIQRDPIFFSHIGNRGLRDGNWKLVALGAKGPWELYDMAHDRSESHDVAADHADIVAKMSAQWTQLSEKFAEQGKTAKSNDKPAKPKK